MDKHNVEPVIVYAGSAWDVGLVKSLLADAGIEAFLEDEFTGTLAPWYTAGGGAGAVKVVVSSEDMEEARKVVEEYEKKVNE